MILHVDMDAFYASVEIRDHPQWEGKPLVVGGSPTGRGVISAANYEARKYGIHSAMPSAKALKLCPQLIFVRGRMQYYAVISKQIRAIFGDFTTLVEPLSLDEAFLDVSGSIALFGDPVSIAKQIKHRIRNELGLTASAGIAPNKYLAKLASDLEKPDGLVVVPPDNISGFLDPLPVARVWGVGKQTQKKLDGMGIKTIGQLRTWPVDSLRRIFGKQGEHFLNLARGEDSRLVVPDRDAKSISHETTFAIDIDDIQVLQEWIVELADQVGRRLRRYGWSGRKIQLKMRYSNFETITRGLTLTAATHSTAVISRSARQLLTENSAQISRGVRLLGVGVTGLSRGGEVQLSLFDQVEESKAAQVDTMTDAIRDRFGGGAVRRGSSLGLSQQPTDKLSRRQLED